MRLFSKSRLLLLLALSGVLLLGSPGQAKAQTITPGTSHENAVENLNKALLPPELNTNNSTKASPNSSLDQTLLNVVRGIKTPTDLQAGINFLVNLFGSVFGFQPTSLETFHPRADTQRQSSLPDSLKPTIQPSLLEDPMGYIRAITNQTNEDLGDKAGIYSVDKPQELKQNKTCASEQIEEKSFFPDGVNPITNGDCK